MILNPLSGFFPTTQAGAVNTAAQNAAMIIDTGQRKVGQPIQKSTAAINVRATLDQAGAEANRQVIIRSVLNRLEGIRQNLIEPDSEWETTAGFLMLTGQPFKINVSQAGEISIDPQVESNLSEYADTQKDWIRDAIEQLKPIFETADFAAQKAEFRNKIQFATLQTVQLDNHYPANEQWEKDYNFYKDLGIPVKIHLDDEGNLTAVNQLETDFLDIVDIDDRIKLQQAATQLENIRNGISSATELWQYSALGSAAGKDDYYLYINDDGNVDVSSNKNSVNLIPDFLLESDDDTPVFTADWQEDALALYQDTKSFHLDFDFQGNIQAVENTFLSVSGILKPGDKSDGILQARLNMFA